MSISARFYVQEEADSPDNEKRWRGLVKYRLPSLVTGIISYFTMLINIDGHLHSLWTSRKDIPDCVSRTTLKIAISHTIFLGERPKLVSLLSH